MRELLILLARITVGWILVALLLVIVVLFFMINAVLWVFTGETRHGDYWFREWK